MLLREIIHLLQGRVCYTTVTRSFCQTYSEKPQMVETAVKQYASQSLPLESLPSCLTQIFPLELNGSNQILFFTVHFVPLFCLVKPLNFFTKIKASAANNKVVKCQIIQLAGVLRLQIQNFFSLTPWFSLLSRIENVGMRTQSDLFPHNHNR